MADKTRKSPHSIDVIEPAAEPVAPSPQAQAFYAEVLRELAKLGIPFLLSGTYALSAYTGLSRATKDLDVLCRPRDYPRILLHFKALGYAIEIEDERWLAKVFQGEIFFDLIFASWHGLMPVQEQWFQPARCIEVLGTTVPIVAPTELIWSKSFLQLRHRYDGADIAHLVLKQSDQIDWPRLLDYMDLYWEVLLTHLLNFRLVYPSERHRVPRWLMDELIGRLQQQLELPPQRRKICRGRLFSPIDYEAAVKDWGFVDVSDESD